MAELAKIVLFSPSSSMGGGKKRRAKAEERRRAFKYWMSADQEHPFVMIAGPLTLAEAEQILRSRFDDRFLKVERLNR